MLPELLLELPPELLLELPELREALERIGAAAGLPEKERCALAAVTLREIAARRGVELKLRRRPR